jgi:hypothetical protein
VPLACRPVAYIRATQTIQYRTSNSKGGFPLNETRAVPPLCSANRSRLFAAITGSGWGRRWGKQAKLNNTSTISNVVGGVGFRAVFEGVQIEISRPLPHDDGLGQPALVEIGRLILQNAAIIGRADGQ